MKKFWNQTVEFKALVISSLATVVGFLGTAVLFWFQHYEIPLAVLLGGAIVAISWLILFLNKKDEKAKVKLDVFAIYLRLALVAIFTILFAVLQITLGVVIISPIFLVISYFVIAMLTLIAFHRKDN